MAVTHRSAAAFVDAEARLFLQDAPLGPGDRVMAGLSVAFDASCEEIWLAWASGACLVPAPRSLVRSGMDLGPWLVANDVTVVSTVPTLVSLWPAEAMDKVRLLILGGEACPPEIGERLATGDREVWNTYGPTEATVVSCGARLSGEGPVRIGLPLDGWDLAVVDAAGARVELGGAGELIIGGVGLARYLDTELDRERFAPMPALGWDRAYRSGDLVRYDDEGLVFLGRADDQVKLGGRRIELGEIDSALLALPDVTGAAAAVRTTRSGNRVLVGYVAVRPGLRRQGGTRDAPGHPPGPAGAAARRGEHAADQDVGQGRPRGPAVARDDGGERCRTDAGRHGGLGPRAVDRPARGRGRRPGCGLLRSRGQQPHRGTARLPPPVPLPRGDRGRRLRGPDPGGASRRCSTA